MKTTYRIDPSIQQSYFIKRLLKGTFTLFFFILVSAARSQAVTEVITDFDGYWKSSSTSINATKPNSSHNLLAFGYNGKRYSTGVNDGLLASRGDSFIVADFWSLPVSSMTGTITSNTKVGLGALYDGVLNGAGSPAPEWGIEKYLTDGIKGLGLGTCIANLPVGSMSFSIQNIQAGAIGDGIPDILVTQIADPGSSYDRYEFTDANGVRIGNYKDIVFTNIAPVGNWTADFYEANSNPLVLTAGFTQTDRPIRLWAADFSEFGITAANLSQIKNFKINLCGNSDVAFVSYNNQSINFKQVLPVQYNFFTGAKSNGNIQLAWQTVSEQAADYFVVERSFDGAAYEAIGKVDAKNKAVSVNNYSYNDKLSANGSVYYRLKQVDNNGNFTYSKTIRLQMEAPGLSIQLYPNPAKSHLFIQHPLARGNEKISVVNLAGVVVKQMQLPANSSQTKINVEGLSSGNYFISYTSTEGKLSAQFSIQ